MSRNKIVIIAACVIAVAAAGTGVMLHTISDNKKNVVYLEGLEAYEAGDYEAAKKAFESVGNYEDTKSILKEIQYQEALLAIEAGDDASAEKTLLTMEDYKEAKNYLYLITYHKIKACMEAKDYDQAEKYADEIMGYEDVAQLKQDIIYQKAMVQVDNAQFEKARELLTKISDAARVEGAVKSIQETQYAVPCLQDLYSRYTENVKITDVLEARYRDVAYNTGMSMPLIMIRYTVQADTGETEELYAAYDNYTYYGACHTLDRNAVDMKNQAEMAGFLKIQPAWDAPDTVRLSAPAMKILAGVQ